MLPPQEGDIKCYIKSTWMTHSDVRMLESSGSIINIGCVDPLGRSALLIAIDNENMEMVDLLLEHKVMFGYYDICT